MNTIQEEIDNAKRIIQEYDLLKWTFEFAGSIYIVEKPNNK